MKPHMEYCLPLWAYCSGEQARFDKVLERAKQVIIDGKTTTISSNDYKIYGLACFANLTLPYAVRQYFYCVHQSDSQVSQLSQINKSMLTRAT